MQKKQKAFLTTKYTNLHERNLKPNAVDFIAGGNIIHRRRVFRPQALKQKAIFTTETTVNTEEKPSADCRASRNNLLIALILAIPRSIQVLLRDLRGSVREWAACFSIRAVRQPGCGILRCKNLDIELFLIFF
jgi:hypothetical protein